MTNQSITNNPCNANTICLYHGDCFDGLAAAVAVYVGTGNIPEENFMPVYYGEEPPWDIIENKHLIIVDFSYKRPIMEKLKEQTKSLIVLDHHASAEKELSDLHYAIFDNSTCGAIIAWEFFNPTKDIPPLFKYIEDHDLWRHKYRNHREIMAWLASQPMTVKWWTQALLTYDVGYIVEQGKPIYAYYQQLCNRMIHYWTRTPTFTFLGGHKVPIINVRKFLVSDVVGQLSLGHPFAVGFEHIGDKYIMHLRSRDDSPINLGDIAHNLGGGGHKHAAGFTQACAPVISPFQLL